VIFKGGRGKGMPVDNGEMSVVAEPVEELVEGLIREVSEGIVPFLVINNVIVKDGGAPFGVGGKNEMRESIPFSV
jgi:hypothetical protein